MYFHLFTPFFSGSPSKPSGVPSVVYERSLGRILVGIGYHDNGWVGNIKFLSTIVLSALLNITLTRATFLHSYGDRSPKSTLGRVFCILWIITGLVIISIFIAMVTASLAATTHPHFPIHGSLVSVSTL